MLEAKHLYPQPEVHQFEVLIVHSLLSILGPERSSLFLHKNNKIKNSKQNYCNTV